MISSNSNENENIHKIEGGSDHVVAVNKVSSVPCNDMATKPGKPILKGLV